LSVLRNWMTSPSCLSVSLPLNAGIFPLPFSMSVFISESCTF